MQSNTLGCPSISRNRYPPPAASCKAKAHELDKVVEGGGPRSGKFSRYKVTIEIKDVPAIGDIKIKDFTDTATVYVKIQVS